jgi:tyrosine-protein phosphatase SIW14
MILDRHLRSRFLSFLLLGSVFYQLGQPCSVRAQSATPSLGIKLHIRGIPNSGKISDRLFRGAQPKFAAFTELKRLGVTTIVNLRSENLRKLEWERGQAVAQGFRFVHIPVNGWSTPKPEQIAQFLGIFSQDPPQKIFIHCHYGDDRTGVFVAAYRIALDRWSAEQAAKEMDYFGFNWFWHPSMKTFVQNFPDTLNSSESLARFRPQRRPP